MALVLTGGWQDKGQLSLRPHVTVTHTPTDRHSHMRVHVSCKQASPNRDGRALQQIEMPVDDKVEMDWLTCPCHVAPSPLNSEEDGWIPWQKVGWCIKTAAQRCTENTRKESKKKWPTHTHTHTYNLHHIYLFLQRNLAKSVVSDTSHPTGYSPQIGVKEKKNNNNSFSVGSKTYYSIRIRK